MPWKREGRKHFLIAGYLQWRNIGKELGTCAGWVAQPVRAQGRGLGRGCQRPIRFRELQLRYVCTCTARTARTASRLPACQARPTWGGAWSINVPHVHLTGLAAPPPAGPYFTCFRSLSAFPLALSSPTLQVTSPRCASLDAYFRHVSGQSRLQLVASPNNPSLSESIFSQLNHT